MAIFDSEKRPRGLRVPSLAALKSSAFQSKKSSESVPSDESTTLQPAFPTPPPPKPPPPPNKELPPPPKMEIPTPPRSSSNNPYFPPVSAFQDVIPDRRPIERVPVPVHSISSRTMGIRSKRSEPDLYATQQEQSPVTLFHPPPMPAPAQAPALALAPAPVDDGNSPQLEDFIPTPDSAEPPLSVPELPREELAPSPFVPPEVEPIAPALSRIHFTCYQQHCTMPVAQNTWCPMPCMTCQKFDIETRHRCVFCCLRICEECFQMLQKCKSRSVEELMDCIST
ncbi:hypothetical protein N7475_009010 [Penicillium sp. IBT 31633x]|nr:hypothetical protein N7475_009010 [Penicillium sp. IBT 31633x]